MKKFILCVAVFIVLLLAACNTKSGDEYSLTIHDNNGQDISSEVLALWKDANRVYDVDDVIMFEMGDSVRLLDNAPEFIELKNYDTVVDAIFTENGKAQLEQTKIGGPATLIQKQDGKTYRMGPWKTGASYAENLEGMAVVSVSDDKIVMRAKYKDIPNKTGYGYADFTLLSSNGNWLVEDYQYPEAYAVQDAS